jgi:outer membrane protein OmpU
MTAQGSRKAVVRVLNPAARVWEPTSEREALRYNTQKGNFVMKKVLYGTTALVAAGLVAGEASAASALKLGITGFYRNAIGGSFGNGPTTQTATSGGGVSTAGLGNFDRQNVSMRQEIRVNFTGQTTLDNGITVGVLVGLNGENVAKSGSTTQVNRAYADFSGKFGLIRVGEANGALTTDCVVDPGNVTSNFGVNSPNESFSDVGFAQKRNKTTGTANVSNSPAGYFSTFGVAPMGSIGTCFGIESKGNKIQYYSPSFGGLTFGVSFTPTGGQRRAGNGLSYGTDVTAPGPGNAGNNILSVGVDYVHDFGGWNLTAGGGGEWAFTQYTPAGGNTNNKPSWYQAGLQVGFGHFAIGASGAYYVNYQHAGYASTTASSSDDGWVVSGGASYTIDAWSFGLQGEYGSYQQSAAAIIGTSAPGVSADNEKMWGISFNTAYALGPGISLEGQVAYTNANYGNLSAFGVSTAVPNFAFQNGTGAPTGVNATQVHSWEIDLGTAINF